METRKRFVTAVRDIIQGDGAVAANPRSAGGWRDRMARLHAGEDGQINLVTAVVMLGFAVLIGLIGNAGNTVKKKIELQNAADATAYSTALWMARGMNAVTTTNHLMGEATAVIVVFESLGGTELGESKGRNTSVALNKALGSSKITAPMVLPGARSVDIQFVNFVYNPMDDNGEHAAHATIYDAKMTLKWATNWIFLVKTLANFGFTPTPIYYITAPIAFGVHIAMNAILAKIVQEWWFLEAIESGAIIVKPAISTVETKVIPTLSQYSDWVAGLPPRSIDDSPQTQFRHESRCETNADSVEAAVRDRFRLYFPQGRPFAAADRTGTTPIAGRRPIGISSTAQ